MLPGFCEAFPQLGCIILRATDAKSHFGHLLGEDISQSDALMAQAMEDKAGLAKLQQGINGATKAKSEHSRASRTKTKSCGSSSPSQDYVDVAEGVLANVTALTTQLITMLLDGCKVPASSCRLTGSLGSAALLCARNVWGRALVWAWTVCRFGQASFGKALARMEPFVNTTKGELSDEQLKEAALVCSALLRAARFCMQRTRCHTGCSQLVAQSS